MSPDLSVSDDGWSVAVLAQGQDIPAREDACWSPVVFPHSADVSTGQDLVYRAEVMAFDPDAEYCRDITLTLIGSGERFCVDSDELQVARVGDLRVLTLPREIANGEPHVLSFRVSGADAVAGVRDVPVFTLRSRLGFSWWHPDGVAGPPLSVNVFREDGQESLVVEACLENRYQLACEGVLTYELFDEQGQVLERSPEFSVALDEREKALHEDTWVVSALPDWWPHRPVSLFLRAKIEGQDGVCDERICAVPLARYRHGGNGVDVNGRTMFWRGVELDVAMPCIGRNVSRESIERDLLRVRETGFLFVVSDRSDDLFLDACDSVGISVLRRNTPALLGEMKAGLSGLMSHSCFAGFIAEDVAGCAAVLEELKCDHRVMVVEPEQLPEYRLESAALEQGMEGLGRSYTRFQRGAGDLVLQEQVDLVRVQIDAQYGAGVSGSTYRLFADDGEQGFDLTGMWDVWRNAKPVAAFMRSLLTPAERGPFVHIAHPWVPGAERRLQVFSNCRVVSLRLNGEIVDTMKADVGEGNASLPFAPFTFRLPEFVSGKLEALGYIDDEEVASHERMSPGDAHALVLEIDDQGIPLVAGGSDAVCVRARLCDERGQRVPDSMQDVKFSVTGAGQLLGENPAPIESGIASVLVRSRRHDGEIVVTALAAGMQEAVLTFQTRSV